MKERLQKIISSSGAASRRKAEEMIAAGRVCVNGITAHLGDGADLETDEILLDGKPLPQKDRNVYILLHKPRGYVSTLSDEKGRQNVTELISGCGVRVYPVGRLDMDSEGLLLLTNDGAYANRMMHPSKEVEKTYEVWVSGFSEDGLCRVSRPVELDGYIIKPPQVKVLEYSGSRAVLQIIIHEGRNRQIRRMCDLAGMKVLRLKRVAEGALQLGDLPLGAWRYLTEKEVAEL